MPITMRGAIEMRRGSEELVVVIPGMINTGGFTELRWLGGQELFRPDRAFPHPAHVPWGFTPGCHRPGFQP